MLLQIATHEHALNSHSVAAIQKVPNTVVPEFLFAMN